MWKPRLLSLVFLCIGIAMGAYLFDWFNMHRTLHIRPAEGEVFMFLVEFFAMIAAVFFGVGGVVASYGIEASGPGLFQVKQGFVGGYVELAIKQFKPKSFCGTAAACGMLLVCILFTLGLCSMFVGLIILVGTEISSLKWEDTQTSVLELWQFIKAAAPFLGGMALMIFAVLIFKRSRLYRDVCPLKE